MFRMKQWLKPGVVKGAQIAATVPFSTADRPGTRLRACGLFGLPLPIHRMKNCCRISLRL